MFDTMTLTKAAGALIGALLFLLLMNWAASALFHVGPSAEGHGEDGHAPQAYTIPLPDEGGEAEAVEEEPLDFAAFMDAADPAAGEKAFGKCKACHKLDGTDGVGPHLNGVVGRTVASVGGFSYSDGMQAHGGDWTPEALQEFLTNPKGVVKGTKMTFGGLKKPEDRANLIAFLQSQQ